MIDPVGTGAPPLVANAVTRADQVLLHGVVLFNAAFATIQLAVFSEFQFPWHSARLHQQALRGPGLAISACSGKWAASLAPAEDAGPELSVATGGRPRESFICLARPPYPAALGARISTRDVTAPGLNLGISA
jgi:hypothetical protein